MSAKDKFIKQLLFLGVSQKVLLIYDSFVNLKDVELFLCRTTDSDLKWSRRELIPADMLEVYINTKNSEAYIEKTCNKDKSKIFACEMKCKTRGVR